MSESVYMDIREWEQFDLDVLNFAQKEMPKECKKFMRREGGKLRTSTRKMARAKLYKTERKAKEKTGNYLKGIRSTKAWQNARGDYGVKVKSNHSIAPHTHLIEFGHKIITRGGNKPQSGKDVATDFNIYRDANADFQSRFYNDALDFSGQMLENGLKGK